MERGSFQGFFREGIAMKLVEKKKVHVIFLWIIETKKDKKITGNSVTSICPWFLFSHEEKSVSRRSCVKHSM